ESCSLQAMLSCWTALPLAELALLLMVQRHTADSTAKRGNASQPAWEYLVVPSLAQAYCKSLQSRPSRNIPWLHWVVQSRQGDLLVPGSRQSRRHLCCSWRASPE